VDEDDAIAAITQLDEKEEEITDEAAGSETIENVADDTSADAPESYNDKTDESTDNQ
jgi:hypothetical protein